jgi:hypothetical protein
MSTQETPAKAAVVDRVREDRKLPAADIRDLRPPHDEWCWVACPHGLPLRGGAVDGRSQG